MQLLDADLLFASIGCSNIACIYVQPTECKYWMQPNSLEVLDVVSLPALTDLKAKMVPFLKYKYRTNHSMMLLLNLYAVFA